MSDFEDKPGHLIRRVHQISTALFTEECFDHDLTAVQYAALVAIRDNPGVDATRLSALITFDRSTIGDVIERLETKGLVLRRATPEDKRIKLLYLTPKGATAVRRVEPAVVKVQTRLLAPLSPSERETFAELMRKLIEGHSDTARPPVKAAAQR